MTLNSSQADAVATATAVRTGQMGAKEVVAAALSRIAARDKVLNCFTAVTADPALAAAEEIDRIAIAGNDPGALAGVPFAVKNLFDIAGLTTLAGSKINAQNPPATQDAAAVATLKRAGAVLVGALNMDEYAYGFVTENSHYGATRNPHDPSRIAGGSSGGSAAAVAGGLVPFALGSDTNGSIRVPASLCGVYGFKPTYGCLSRAGTILFSSSLDHIGPFARSVRDIATIFDVLQPSDTSNPVLSQLDRGIEDIRIAIADEYFATGAQSEVLAAVERVASALNVTLSVTLPEAKRARAAAYIITASEGANAHFPDLRSRPQDFDPQTRDRFLAGALIPASWYLQAQRFRRWYRDRLREVFCNLDLIVAPTTPCTATPIGQTTVTIDGQQVLLRPNLGLYTQPLSFIGLPVLSIPIQQKDALPIGIQLIAAPYNEAIILRVAAVLESQGITRAAIAT